MIRRKLHDIESMDQLCDYIEDGKGSVPGQFWMLEELYEGGGELEIGLNGTYKVNAIPDSYMSRIVFQNNSETHFPVVTINESTLALGGVKVFSRKNFYPAPLEN